ncbi:MAG TPA: sigma 54-interacting transcriptional regulator [Enhygromyxa sp.]|nr:sigma 54-interacting transcriptional regulator [Enhygromyxa sp.]
MNRRSTECPPRESDPGVRLAFEHADGRRQSLPQGRPLLIGSAHDCGLRVGGQMASRHHARVIYTPRGYRLEDLGSSSGTWVDGVPVSSTTLEPGMRVEIGRARMLVTRIDDPRHEAASEAELAAAADDDDELAPPQHCLIGRSKVIRTLRRQLERLALLPLPVLIHGETGTGKELAARTLHEFSEHREGPFVALNCGAIPDGLFESELFGHRRGAFTGAHRDHAGAFVRAANGTVFLDEVGELPLSAQTKLLRVLETRRLTPVGSDQEVTITCRIVAATHRDLAAMVVAGQFREDLFHRLSVVELELPPLRRRRQDIPILLSHFADLASAELGREVVISQLAAAEAVNHPWPGNVRALRNAVLRAAALADGPIGPAELIPEVEQPRARSETISVPRGTYASMHTALLQQIVHEEGSIRRAARVLEIPRSTLGAWLRGCEEEDDHDAADEPDFGPRRGGSLVNKMTKSSPSSRPLDPR